MYWVPAFAGMTIVATMASHADVTPAKKGRHVVRWIGTGACIAACETQFNAESEVV